MSIHRIDKFIFNVKFPSLPYRSNQTWWNLNWIDVLVLNVKVPVCLVAPAAPALELLVDGLPQTVVGETDTNTDTNTSVYFLSIFKNTWRKIKVRPGDAVLTTCHAKTGNPVPEVQVGD